MKDVSMREKEEILAGINDSKQFINVEARKLEVLIDIRDLLDLLVHPKYKMSPGGKVEQISVED